MKRIGVLTSGGDAPGMNAAIRAVVRYGKAGPEKMEVYGVERGFAGLLEGGVIKEMDMRSVSDIIHKGGTVLKTARCPEFLDKAVQKKAIERLRDLGLEGLIVIGGDGSFMGAKALSEQGFPCVGIPGTIDNDLGYTDYTLGFETACNTVLDAINKLRDTMTAHERVSIVQVMGRNAGDIALYAGIGGGAEVIIVPEIELDLDGICATMLENKRNGKVSGIVVLAEGVVEKIGSADVLETEIRAKTGLSVRTTVLGHIQRGGSPSNQDRYLGTNFGVKAVQRLSKSIDESRLAKDQNNAAALKSNGYIVGIKDGKFIEVDIVKGLKKKKVFNQDLYDVAAVVAK
jgi:6-phosphofructokinase 1